MLETPFRRVEVLENAAEYAGAIRARRNRLLLYTIAATLFALSVVVVIRLLAPNYLNAAPLLALVAVGVAALPVFIWNDPKRGFYILTIGACLFVITPSNEARDLVGNMPFWWNVTTAVEHFTGSRAASFVHFSLAEIIMAMTLLFWMIRQIVMRQFKFRGGALWPSLAAYSAFCLWGFILGMSKGGVLELALQEVRAQFYFCLAYLLAINLITTRKQAMTLVWIIILCIGVRCIEGTIIYAQNTNITVDEGVLSHEDSLLVNIVIFAGLLFTLAKVEPKLKRVCLFLIPFAIITSLANGRRTGIASLLVAFPIVIIMCAVLLRERRKAIVGFLIVFSILSAIYMPIAWNSEATWALPAHAIKSQSDPDPRDASSDTYRLNENANLRFTRDTAPLLGYGYGREFLHPYPLPGRTDLYIYVLPHNGILWIWMRLGHIGFFLFWMFVATVLTKGPNLIKSIRDSRLQTLGILGIATFLMLIIYGQYDLSFANFRTMWVTGTLLGIMTVMPRLIDLKREERAAAGLSNAGQAEGDDLDVREVGEISTLVGEGDSESLVGKRWQRVDW